MAQKLAPAEKNSTDISAASATFCISGCNDDIVTDVNMNTLSYEICDFRAC